MARLFIFTLLIISLSKADDIKESTIKDAECNVACRLSGYDNGGYVADNCYCYDWKPYDYMTAKRIIIRAKRGRTSSNQGSLSPSVPQSSSPPWQVPDRWAEP